MDNKDNFNVATHPEEGIKDNKNLGNPCRMEIWMKFFNDLQQFYQANGHLSTDNRRLSKWLSYQKNHTNSLTHKKLNLLDSIEYKNLAKKKDRFEKEWEMKYAELKAIYDEVGHPRAPTRPLASWLSRQKKKWALGELTVDRCERLEQIGVGPQEHIKITKPTRNRREGWIQSFNRLKEFQAKTGHTRVEYNYKDDPSLGKWVASQ